MKKCRKISKKFQQKNFSRKKSEQKYEKSENKNLKKYLISWAKNEKNLKISKNFRKMFFKSKKYEKSEKSWKSKIKNIGKQNFLHMFVYRKAVMFFCTKNETCVTEM